MTIGTGIVLFVIGAILTFALDVQLEGVNLDMIGYILMAAGAVAFLIGLILLLVRRDRPQRGTVVEDDVL
jgi:sugar phosphate permease